MTQERAGTTLTMTQLSSLVGTERRSDGQKLATMRLFSLTRRTKKVSILIRIVIGGKKLNCFQICGKLDS